MNTAQAGQAASVIKQSGFPANMTSSGSPGSYAVTHNYTFSNESSTAVHRTASSETKSTDAGSISASKQK